VPSWLLLHCNYHALLGCLETFILQYSVNLWQSHICIPDFWSSLRLAWEASLERGIAYQTWQLCTPVSASMQLFCHTLVLFCIMSPLPHVEFLMHHVHILHYTLFCCSIMDHLAAKNFIPIHLPIKRAISELWSHPSWLQDHSWWWAPKTALM